MTQNAPKAPTTSDVLADARQMKRLASRVIRSLRVISGDTSGEQQDAVTEFLQQRTATVIGQRTGKKELYHAFRDSAQGGRDWPLTARTFNREVSRVHFSRSSGARDSWLDLVLKPN